MPAVPNGSAPSNNSHQPTRTHPLRRTKAALICKQTGNLTAVQILLGNTKIESTVRILASTFEAAFALAEGIAIYEHAGVDALLAAANSALGGKRTISAATTLEILSVGARETTKRTVGSEAIRPI